MKRIFSNSAVKRSLLRPSQQLRFASKDANRGVTSATSMNTNAPPFTKSDQELRTNPPPSSPFGASSSEPLTDVKNANDKLDRTNATPTRDASSAKVFEQQANPIGGMGHGVAASNQAAETNQPFSTDPSRSTTATNWNPTERRQDKSTNYGAFEKKDMSTESSKSGGSSQYSGQQDFDKSSGKQAGFQDANLDKKMPNTPIVNQFQSNDAPFSDAKQAFNKYPAGSKPEVTNDSNRSTFKNEGKADQLNKQGGSSFGDKSSGFNQSKSGSGNFDNQMNRNFYDKSTSDANQSFADRSSGSGSGNFGDKLSGKGNVVNKQSGKFSNDTTINMGDKSNFQKANNIGDKQFDNLDMGNDLKSGKSDNSGFMNDNKKI